MNNEHSTYSTSQIAKGIKILKNTALGLPIGDVTVSVIIMLVIAVICSIISVKFFKWE